MKNILLILISVISLGYTSNAQVSNLDSQSKMALQISDTSLINKTKMELTEIYLNEIFEISKNLPYTPFTFNVPDSMQNQLDMPQSKYLDRKRDKITNMSNSYGELMKSKLYEIIPYADKKEIINSILFLKYINSTIK